MLKEIIFPRIVNFLGRNGTFKQKGIEVMQSGNIVHLTAISTKGNARCQLQLPTESVAALHLVLGEIVYEND